MRFWLSGPRVLGLRPGITFRPNELFVKPAPVAKQSQGGFIYVVRSADSNLVKIGVSSNPSARLASLQTASASRLSLAYIGALRCDGFAIERNAHEILNSYSEGGEWFSCGTDMAVASISTAAYHLNEPLASVDPKIVDQVVASVALGSSATSRRRFPVWWFILAIIVWAFLMHFIFLRAP